MEQVQCSVCEAYFRPTAITDGKCSVCNQMFPGVKSRKELKLKSSPTKAQTMTEDVVQQMIYDTLEDAGIKRFECEKCQTLYYKTSPAQKQCSRCRDKGDK